MTFRSRHAVGAILALGLLVLGGRLFRNQLPAGLRPEHTTASPGPLPSPATGAAVGVARPPSVQPTSAAAWAEVTTPTTSPEPGLPAAPSGDYELDLSPEQISAVVDRRYAELFHSLRLPPDRHSRLRSLLVERQQAAVDAANAALLTGLNPIRDLATINQAIAQAQAEIDATVREELGDPIHTALIASDRGPPARQVIATLTRELAATPHPLRPEQEKQLLQLLLNPAHALPPADLSQAIFGPGPTEGLTGDQVAVLASSVLTPAQLQKVRDWQHGQGTVQLQPN